MSDSTLIELVRNYEELFNLQHRHYSNQQRRDNIWEEIGEQLGENVATCKARWQKIRENYRKALALRKTKSGQAADKIKPPKYHQELSFLTPYLNDDETRRSSIPDFSRPSSSQDSPEYTCPDFIFDSPPDTGGDSQLSVSSLNTSRFSNSQKRRYTTPSRAPSSPNDQRSTAATVLKDFLSRTEQTQNQQIKSEDPLIDFFLTMAKTVAKFPVHKQLKIKSQLFQMVHSVECEIAESSSVTEETVPPPSRIMSSDMPLPTQSITAASTSPTSAVTFSHPSNKRIQIHSYDIISPPTNIAPASTPSTSATTLSRPFSNQTQAYEIITPPINTASVSSQEQREEDVLTSGTVRLASKDDFFRYIKFRK